MRDNTMQISIENIAKKLFEDHNKLKVGKILSIDIAMRTCQLEFYEYVSSVLVRSFLKVAAGREKTFVFLFSRNLRKSSGFKKSEKIF